MMGRDLIGKLHTHFACQRKANACIYEHDLGLAKTGSGKTFSYVWPMIEHVLSQPQVTRSINLCTFVGIFSYVLVLNQRTFR